MLKKAIFLDRDGVVNKEVNYLFKIEDFEFIDGIFDACLYFQNLGYAIIIITNQSGIDRGIIQYNDFIDINTKMINEIDKAGGAISAILYCPTLPSVKNKYRKPGSGMFEEISERLNFSLKSCFSIGDSPRDIIASINAGCKPLGVRTGNGSKISDDSSLNIPMFNDLYEAVEFVLKKNKKWYAIF